MAVAVGSDRHRGIRIRIKRWRHELTHRVDSIPAGEPLPATDPSRLANQGMNAVTTGPSRSAMNTLWAIMLGYFMIPVDASVVAIASPVITAELDADYDMVIWLTSVYLLAYTVPLLTAGRLGDRFGLKNLYLIGLATFTAASLWCALSSSIEMLIAARVVQGLGAALLTPQTLAVITRTFPPDRRGLALSIWGATAGIATLVGPLAGGILVDALGWEWIFIVNVPIGIVGLALGYRFVPVLPTHPRRFDLIGVGWSGLGIFLIVFALQQGQSADWAPWTWAMILAGAVCLSVFLRGQWVNTREPLIPLRMFASRNFALANLGVAAASFATMAMVLTTMFYAQTGRGLSATGSALLIAPMALAGVLLVPLIGKIVDRFHPRNIIGFGFSALAVTLAWLAIEMAPTTPIWRLVLPVSAMGIAMAFLWPSLAAIATRDLAADLTGAGSGVYNATRLLGAVMGSASMAAFTNPNFTDSLREPLSAALSHSMLLSAVVALLGALAALFMVRFAPAPIAGARPPERGSRPLPHNPPPKLAVRPPVRSR